jgi:hypothetical protein
MESNGSDLQPHLSCSELEVPCSLVVQAPTVAHQSSKLLVILRPGTDVFFSSSTSREKLTIFSSRPYLHEVSGGSDVQNPQSGSVRDVTARCRFCLRPRVAATFCHQASRLSGLRLAATVYFSFCSRGLLCDTEKRITSKLRGTRGAVAGTARETTRRLRNRKKGSCACRFTRLPSHLPFQSSDRRLESPLWFARMKHST